MDDTDPCQINGCDFGGLVDHDGNPMCLVCGRVDYTPREDDDDFDDGMPNAALTGAESVPSNGVVGGAR